ncbi:hypothetical protein [Litoribacillus peritrichatus]|uniref:Uncharacterized protein n=1 Tax=Litoribacillus peritrichatus TaxID=718191 RepID=A0ABP7MRN9_9GAMM
MQSCEKFATKLLRESDPDSVTDPLVQLTFGGNDVGSPVKGACLAQQYHLSELGYLLFLTDNVPYEETLRIYLVTEEAKVIDELEFGGNMVTGTLDIIDLNGKDTIVFSFIHEANCRLQVLSTPKWSKPLVFTPGVRRNGSLRKHYLKLDFQQ